MSVRCLCSVRAVSVQAVGVMGTVGAMGAMGGCREVDGHRGWGDSQARGACCRVGDGHGQVTITPAVACGSGTSMCRCVCPRNSFRG